MDGLILVLISFVGILFTIQKALGVDHTVQGWEATAVDVGGYRRSKMVFSVGDGLVFKMDGGEADIAQVSKSDYELCNAEAPKAIYRAEPTAAIYFNRIGNWYFISSDLDRCKSGKKLMITVVAAHNNTRKKKRKNRPRFRFRERMEVGRRGGRGGHGIGGGSPGYSTPKGYENRLPTRGRSHGSSAPRHSAVDFKSLLMAVFFCSVLLAGPLLV